MGASEQGSPWRLPCRQTGFLELDAAFGLEPSHLLFDFLSTSIRVSGVQINPNSEQLGAEEADRGGIAGAARQLNREPVLALAWIIVGE